MAASYRRPVVSVFAAARRYRLAVSAAYSPVRLIA